MPDNPHVDDMPPGRGFGMTGRSAVQVHPVTMRIIVEVNPELDATIDNMAEELGLSKGMTILKALSLLKTALEARSEGKRIVIVNDVENSEQEITL